MVHRSPATPLAAQLGVVVLLAATVGLSPRGWLAGAACGVVLSVLLARGRVAYGSEGLGPADLVTLLRAALVGGVAALVADASARAVPVATLVALTAVALVLDGVDGRVARRTGTASRLGARFDEEVDAFLILVLSAHVARSFGVWVLAIGIARYAYAMAGSLLPWLPGPLPPRYWGKVVAVTQGVVLTVAAAGVLPRLATYGLLLVAVAVLTESFAHSVRWRWRHRPAEGRFADARRAGLHAPSPAD
jgi:phosphatidylglycerophosphate synthase